MNAHGRMIRIDSKPAPPVTPPTVTDDDVLRAIDAIMAASVKREQENERLRAALDGLLMAIDSRGVGFSKAVEAARKARR